MLLRFKLENLGHYNTKPQIAFKKLTFETDC